MKAIERLYQYLEKKEIKPTNFEKRIGLSNGYLSIQKKRVADLGETIFNKIIDNCPDLNPIWLITGRGEMLKEISSDMPASLSSTTKVFEPMTERLKIFINNAGLSVSAFEQKISASDGMIRRAINNNTDIQSKWLESISDNFPEINLEWLITGNGEMLKNDIDIIEKINEITDDQPKDDRYLHIIESLSKTIESQQGTILILSNLVKDQIP